MKQSIPSFNQLADSEFEGMFFKDEGIFLTVKIEKSTGKPTESNKMYEFGELKEAHIGRADLQIFNTVELLKGLINLRAR